VTPRGAPPVDGAAPGGAAVGGTLLGVGSLPTAVPAATVSPRLGFRAALAVALVGILLGGIAVVSATSATGAAWTDRGYASAAVSAGTWAVAPGGNTCVALNGGGNAVGTCRVTSVRYEEWGSAGNHTRNYYMTFAVSQPGPTRSIQVDIDLSTATGTTTGTGSWNWANTATLVSTGQFTPSSTCAGLPRLQGTTISGWDWATGPAVYFTVTDNRSGAPVATQTCR